jgi:hypothetical protein
MNALRSALLSVALGLPCVCLAADEKKADLPSFTHQYYWQEFTVSKEAPFSDNRSFRLKEVRKNGEVELIDCAVASIATKIVVVKPVPKKLSDGDRPPTIIVVVADYAKQSATIRELRMK